MELTKKSFAIMLGFSLVFSVAIAIPASNTIELLARVINASQYAFFYFWLFLFVGILLIAFVFFSIAKFRNHEGRMTMPMVFLGALVVVLSVFGGILIASGIESLIY